MGAAASINQEEELGSSQLCPSCDRETHDIFYCDKCESASCPSCCSHCPRKGNPVYWNQHNLMYRKQMYLVNVDEVADDPKQEFKRVRGGCFTFGRKLALLCCYYHRDFKCSCCNITSRWRLCYIGEKGKLISGRLHARETRRYPGQLTFSKKTKMAYMTSPAKKTVFKISATNDAYKAFETSGKCFGIACFDGGFAISVLIESDFKLPSWQIQYVDFAGQIKKRITHDSETRQPLFASPKFLASNLTEDTLFVSDNGTLAITALDVKGNVLFQYSSRHIRNPCGITVDTENNVYVADGHRVVQIEAGGKSSHIVKFLVDAYVKFYNPVPHRAFFSRQKYLDKCPCF